MISHCDVICIYLMASDVEYLFMCLVVIVWLLWKISQLSFFFSLQNIKYKSKVQKNSMLPFRIKRVYKGIPVIFFVFLNFIYLFIFGCVGSLLLRAGFL